MNVTHQIKQQDYYSTASAIPDWLKKSFHLSGNGVGINTTNGLIDLDKDDLLKLNEDGTVTIFAPGMKDLHLE